MKTITKTIFAVLALTASALVVNAQDAGGPPGPPDGEPPPRHAGPGGMNGHRPPPPSPLMEALDTNHDGIIDSNEIANAPAALRKLDKNGDGRLTPDELRPQHPPWRDGQDGPPGPEGPGPQGPPGDNQRPPGNN